MSKRSEEGDVLNLLWEVIIDVLVHHLHIFAASVVSNSFVPQLTVQNILSQTGVGNASKVREIMGAVTANITVESKKNITGRFNHFVILLHNLELDTLAQRLVTELSKYEFVNME